MSVRERAISAALRMIDVASMKELLSTFTVEALHNEIEPDQRGARPSPAKLRSEFSVEGTESSFNRERLFDAMLERAVDETLDVATGNTEGYLQAADAIARGGGPESFVAALAGDLGDFEPQPVNTARNARERIYYLAIAMSDGDDARAIRRRLKDLRRDSMRIYEAAYTAFLDVFQRRLATNVTYEQLYFALSGYLEGVLLMRRHGTPINDETVADSMIRVFWAHTTPIGAREDAEPIGELWATVKRKPGRQWMVDPRTRRAG